VKPLLYIIPPPLSREGDKGGGLSNKGVKGLRPINNLKAIYDSRRETVYAVASWVCNKTGVLWRIKANTGIRVSYNSCHWL